MFCSQSRKLGEKEKKKKNQNENCKAFCVKRKRNKVLLSNTADKKGKK